MEKYLYENKEILKYLIGGTCVVVNRIDINI